MVLFYCDHCHKGIEIESVHMLGENDVYGDRRVIKKHLCPECYRTRKMIHAELDRQFLHMDNETKKED